VLAAALANMTVGPRVDGVRSGKCRATAFYDGGMRAFVCRGGSPNAAKEAHPVDRNVIRNHIVAIAAAAWRSGMRLMPAWTNWRPENTRDGSFSGRFLLCNATHSTMGNLSEACGGAATQN
jgi:hypothetical protein